MVLPLVAIATPATYVREPLRVFELDFEANLPIVRACVRYRKRLVFPRPPRCTACARTRSSIPKLATGLRADQQTPLDLRLRQADDGSGDLGLRHGAGLDFTLFRPFNWIGAGLDSINTPRKVARVITQFLGPDREGESIKLVDGGTQRRSFTYIDDGIDALMRIIANERSVTSGKIHNIGNPRNNLSVRELAVRMLELAAEYPEYRDRAARVQLIETTANDYYGQGYQDVQQRVPKIANTCADLDWRPEVTMDEALRRIFEAYRTHAADAGTLVD